MDSLLSVFNSIKQKFEQDLIFLQNIKKDVIKSKKIEQKNKS